jgi:hypothetical protein
MRRLLILAIAATLTLSACGTGAVDGGSSTDAATPPSASPTPTAEGLPTPTPLPTTLPTDAPEAEFDLVPARITAHEGYVMIWNAAGEGLEAIPYDIKPKDAVKKFTELFGVAPTRIAHPPVVDNSIPFEWQSGDYDLDGWDFRGFQIFPRNQIYDLRAWEIRATVAAVMGITIEFEDGTRVGQATSSVTDDLGDPWPADSDYMYGTFPSTRGYLFFRAPGTTTVAAWLVPYGP